MFKEQSEINQRYLESLPLDRLLHSFRVNAGLPSSAKPYGGWEKPACELRGHFTGGHYLSAVALSYASSGNDVLKNRGNQMVDALAACQKAGQKANGAGYVSAFPSSFFERMARGEKVWAPFYTLHKIFAGLLDMSNHAGNEDAVKVAEGIAAWTRQFFAGMGDDQRQRILRREHGGMNESLVNLAHLTGKDEYLNTAKMFEQPVLLDPLAQREDQLQGLHANTTVPKIIGAGRTYEVTGDRRYRDIAEYFLEEVTRSRNYVIGNTSDGEFWHSPAGGMKGTLSLKNAECCVSYNMMKLMRMVYGWSGDAHWMDEYERTLLNARLGTQNADGLKQYFFPLAAGYYRTFNSPEESFWCCTGTGAEDFAKFNDTIYFHSDDDVYVNQYIPSELTWTEKGFGLVQETGFPAEQVTRIVVHVSQPQERTVLVRIPRWTKPMVAVQVNGQPLDVLGQPGSYLAIRRRWNTGDSITLPLTMTLQEESLPGDNSVSATLYGPLVLAEATGMGPESGPNKILGFQNWPSKVPGEPAPLPPATAIQLVSAPELKFTNGRNPVMPVSAITGQRYAVYRQKPGTSVS